MTDPARDDGPAERNNWNAILKWSLAQTDEDAGAEPAREISEADREWFVRAMESGMVDEIKRMKDITAALSANTAEVLDAEEIDARVELIEELNDRVCSIDNGGDLHTIGGLVPLVGTMASPHARLRAAAAETLATTVQNHPKAQASALESGAMAPLLRMAAGEGGDAPPSDAPAPDPAQTAPRIVACRVKALLGLSCLTRGCPKAQDAFILGDGFTLLRDCLRVDDLRVRTKTLHLARHLVTLSERAMNAGVSAGFILAGAASLAAHIPGDVPGDGEVPLDIPGNVPGDGMSDADIARGQVREAALRLMLDIAKCVDFGANPKAVDHFRGAVVVNAINAVGRWYAGLNAEQKETYNDEMLVCAELAKMFG